MVDPRLEEVKIILNQKSSSWEFVPESSYYWEEALRMELPFYLWDTKGVVDGSTLCTWHGGSSMWRSELVEQINVIRQKIWHGKSDIVVRGLAAFRFVEWKIINQLLNSVKVR